MDKYWLLVAAAVAFYAASQFTARTMKQIMLENRFDEDRIAHEDEEFPGPRRSLHFIRQDVASVAVGITIANGLLAVVATALVWKVVF